MLSLSPKLTPGMSDRVESNNRSEIESNKHSARNRTGESLGAAALSNGTMAGTIPRGRETVLVSSHIEIECAMSSATELLAIS